MDSVAAPASTLARQGDGAALARLWAGLRAELLQAYEPLWHSHERVAERREWNLPLWELGHVAWFAERWTLRQPDRARGTHANPLCALPPGRCRDDFYDSSRVPHAQRWQLPLPGRSATLALLAQQLADSLDALAAETAAGAVLYPYRLSLLHEAMHLEAARLLARGLGVERGLPTPAAAPSAGPELVVPAQILWIGQPPGTAGFAFDNELTGRAAPVAALRVDARVRRWADLLPWMRSSDWADDRLWSSAGAVWRRQQRARDWDSLEPAAPAEPLSAYEAEAWCVWAGRRLLSEAEWLAAARQPGFVWGEVWEWLSEPFAPLPGFPAHPYRDYSAPWFDGQHRLLKGASRYTPACLRDARFRNFYLPQRSDLVAGLRSAAHAQSPTAP